MRMSCSRQICSQTVLLPFLKDGPNCINGDIEFIVDLLIFHFIIMMVNFYSMNLRKLLYHYYFENLLCLCQKSNVHLNYIQTFLFISLCSGWSAEIWKYIIWIEFNSKLQILFCFINIFGMCLKLFHASHMMNFSINSSECNNILFFLIQSISSVYLLYSGEVWSSNNRIIIFLKSL